MILGVQVSKRTTGSMRRVKKGSMMEAPFRAYGGWKNRGARGGHGDDTDQDSRHLLQYLNLYAAQRDITYKLLGGGSHNMG